MGGRLQDGLGDRVDLLVVGGGVYGACLARLAAQRGIAVALVERADFSGGTSGQSLRILHGGLRYLQHADLIRMRESIRARRDWMRRFGGLVTPQAFSLPTFGHGVRGREAFAVALALNDLVSWDRNVGVAAGQRMPRGRVLSRRQAGELYAGYEVEGYNGAALWYDAVSVDSERILIELLGDARRAGARIANHAEATAIRCVDGAVRAVELEDRITGASHELETGRVVVTAGPWTAGLLRRSDLSAHGTTHYSLAMNLVVRGFEVPHGLGVPVRRQGRDTDAVVDSGTNSYFFLPWREHTMIGTRHFSVEPGDATPEIVRQCRSRFLEEIDALTKGSGPTDSSVVATLAGWLPEAGEVRPDRDPVLAKHPLVVDHGDHGAGGLTTVVGVKWTTAEVVARDALRRAFPGASPRVEPDQDWKPATSPALTRETVAHQIREEWALRLDDLVLRRNALWASDDLDDAGLEQLAGWAGDELGWDEDERAKQVAATRAALAALRGPRCVKDDEAV